MLTHRVTFDGTTYHLNAKTDMPEFKKLVHEGITSGARYVDFQTVAGHTVSVLITPLTRAAFDEIAVAQPLPADYVYDPENIALTRALDYYDLWETA